MMRQCLVAILVFLGGAGCDPPQSAPPPPSSGPPLALGPIVRLTHTTTDSQTFLNTAKGVAVGDDGVIHVAWLEIVAAAPFPGHARRGQIVYSRSVDGGKSFSAPGPLTPVVGEVGTPKVAAASTSVFMVWHQSDSQRSQIILARSEDSGVTWMPYPAPLGPGAFPSLDAWSGGAGAPSVHVVWGNSQVASGISEIYLANSADGGRSFSAPVMVSSDDGRSSWTPAVTSWGSVVHVAWTDERFNVDAQGRPYDCSTVGGGATCHEEEFYRRSPDGGATFPGPEVRLTMDPPGMPKYSWAPSIVAWGPDVHLAYFDARTGAFQIYYRRSADAGATWGGEASLTGQLPQQPMGGWWRPSLAARDRQLVVAFWRQADAVASSVWAMRSEDIGATWSAPVALSEGAAALHPAAALSPDGAAHLVWYDSPDGNEEMYYRRVAAPE